MIVVSREQRASDGTLLFILAAVGGWFKIGFVSLNPTRLVSFWSRRKRASLGSLAAVDL